MPDQATIDAAAERRRAEAFLRRDPLRQIVPLKMLRAYATALQCHVVEDDRHTGVLLLLPTVVSAWDAAHYAATDLVVLLVADHPTLADTLLAHVPTDRHLVFKVANTTEAAAIRRRFSVLRTTAFISFTNHTYRAFARHPSVHVTTLPDPRCLRIFAEQGHEATTLCQALASDEALVCLLEQDGAVAATCFAMRIFESIWEIGGVYTAPPLRRQSLGRRLVETALSVLVERGLIPRYQVQEDNLASWRLAEAVGLHPFVTIEHFLTEHDDVSV